MKRHGKDAWCWGQSMRKRNRYQSWIQGHRSFLRALAQELFRF